MKSRTSSSDWTVFKKDILRFAPLWGVYLIIGALVTLNIIDASTLSLAESLSGSLSGMGVISMGFAALAAQLLFGDLFRTRMCNALHALPLRREKWFGLHILSGLLMFLVPNLLFSLIMLPWLGKLWYLSFAWLGAVSMQYLFFFGLAVLSIFCAGNRLGALAVYAIGNFFFPLIQLFVATIYKPLLYGLSSNLRINPLLCPVAEMMAPKGGQSFWDVFYNFESASPDAEPDIVFGGFNSFLWKYLAVIAAIGVVLAGLALLLYHRRHLESAGDFIAFRPVAPLFLIIYTLCWSLFFTVFSGLFGLTSSSANKAMSIVLMAVGAAFGFFTGEMFLKRTVSVFRPRLLIKGIVVVAVFLASLGITAADPAGLTKWTPNPGDVTSLNFNVGYSHHMAVKVTRPDLIEEAVAIHKAAVEAGPVSENYMTSSRFSITYRDKNQNRRERIYFVQQDSPLAAQIGRFLSRPEMVFEYADSSLTWEQFRDQVINAAVYDIDAVIPQEDIPSLLDAVYQDCLEGRMSSANGAELYIHLDRYIPGRGTVRQDIEVMENSVNTIAWLKAYGMAE